MDLWALCFALWAALHPGLPGEHDAPKIADAIATAVGEEKTTVFGGREEDAAVMALFAVKESWLRLDATGDEDKDGHPRAFGAWQQWNQCGKRGALAQARCWIWLAHAGARSCPESPATPLLSGKCHVARGMAEARVSEAKRILAALRAKE